MSEEESGDEEDDALADECDNSGLNGNNSKAKKMPWSEEEDKLVIRLVE